VRARDERTGGWTINAQQERRDEGNGGARDKVNSIGERTRDLADGE